MTPKEKFDRQTVGINIGILFFAIGVLGCLIIWMALDIDHKFKVMDERIWNVENAQ